MRAEPRYEVIIYWSADDEAFIAEVPELPGCAADGSTYEAALANVRVIIDEWIETADRLGKIVPKPSGQSTSGKQRRSRSHQEIPPAPRTDGKPTTTSTTTPIQLENMSLWDLRRIDTTNDRWAYLPKLDRDEQSEVMKSWFHAHYEDPAEQTPYESAEGGYIWIFGGPYDAREELEAEFDGAVPDQLIEDVANELNSIMPWWARSADYEDDGDESLWDAISANGDARATFDEAVTGIEETMQIVSGPVAHRIRLLLYANAITALEVFLSDTFINKVTSDELLLGKFFKGTHNPTKKHVRLEEFPSTESAKSAARTALTRMSWHNLSRAEALYEETLGINFAEAATTLKDPVDIRHDIVHRNGKTKDGMMHILGPQEVNHVISAVRALADTVEQQYNAKFAFLWPNGESEF
jgi:predicted RNase H-like HicB family nuclease